MRGISFVVAPIRKHAFFKQTVLQCQVSHDLLQGTRFTAQILNLAARRCTSRVASQPTLSSFQKLFRPSVIQALRNAFLAAKLSNAVFAAQAFQNNPGLVFGEKCRRVARRISLTTCSAGRLLP
jgi:hypothetical protein